VRMPPHALQLAASRTRTCPRACAAVQVVLSIAALHKGLLSVVANSLVGSILSNLLLVMGGCACCWS